VSVLVYNCTLSVYDALVLWHNRSAATYHSVYREWCKVTDGREELPICSRVFYVHVTVHHNRFLFR